MSAESINVSTECDFRVISPQRNTHKITLSMSPKLREIHLFCKHKQILFELNGVFRGMKVFIAMV